MERANLRRLVVMSLGAAVLLAAIIATAAADAELATSANLAFVPGESLALPAPTMAGGMPLMTALANRHSSREFSPDALPLQTLSDLLWAATGVNRPDTGKRTAATARNWQSLDVYVVTAAGTYRYEPAGHALVAVRPGDQRAATGAQPFVSEAAVNLVYVSDGAKMPGVEDAAQRALYDGTHAGIVAQNVYLFATSEGLAVVLRAMVDREALATALGLAESQKVVMAQSVGHPQAGS
ncbi:MAG: SagB/ThcOx family dehydrogenase [Candidatus Latescibacteria bacterium]|nr:SagB/ThcOx family dehydrogenase [Candidatus Latescibacterota bacterium]